ncbi:MAG: hypothetical protein J0J01_21135 [Reyranella sp.]|uniref:hypothetical protein n=1 Tax=Reyranella sp. TaxID=1929291 RepID=UPI001AC7E009|nr:hypothetical protein [Reyranella sp.]MBN9089422.1 hypothetical protein [Reyranella sp.]
MPTSGDRGDHAGGLRRQVERARFQGAGELGICAAGAAVANTIYNACGVRMRDYPITPDKILSSFARPSLAQRR